MPGGVVGPVAAAVELEDDGVVHEAVDGGQRHECTMYDVSISGVDARSGDDGFGE